MSSFSLQTSRISVSLMTAVLEPKSVIEMLQQSSGWLRRATKWTLLSEEFRLNLVPVAHRSLYCRVKVAGRIRLQHISLCASSERRSPALSFNILGHENDSRTRRNLANALCGFDSVQEGHSNVQENNIRQQFRCSLNGFHAVAHLANNLPVWPRLQYGLEKASALGEVIGNKDTKRFLMVWVFGHIEPCTQYSRESGNAKMRHTSTDRTFSRWLLHRGGALGQPGGAWKSPRRRRRLQRGATICGFLGEAPGGRLGKTYGSNVTTS